jgi:hypothetical protein
VPSFSLEWRLEGSGAPNTILGVRKSAITVKNIVFHGKGENEAAISLIGDILTAYIFIKTIILHCSFYNGVTAMFTPLAEISPNNPV